MRIKKRFIFSSVLLGGVSALIAPLFFVSAQKNRVFYGDADKEINDERLNNIFSNLTHEKHRFWNEKAWIYDPEKYGNFRNKGLFIKHIDDIYLKEQINNAMTYQFTNDEHEAYYKQINYFENNNIPIEFKPDKHLFIRESDPEIFDSVNDSPGETDFDNVNKDRLLEWYKNDSIWLEPYDVETRTVYEPDWDPYDKPDHYDNYYNWKKELVITPNEFKYTLAYPKVYKELLDKMKQNGFEIETNSYESKTDIDFADDNFVVFNKPSWHVNGHGELIKYKYFWGWEDVSAGANLTKVFGLNTQIFIDLVNNLRTINNDDHFVWLSQQIGLDTSKPWKIESDTLGGLNTTLPENIKNIGQTNLQKLNAYFGDKNSGVKQREFVFNKFKINVSYRPKVINNSEFILHWNIDKIEYDGVDFTQNIIQGVRKEIESEYQFVNNFVHQNDRSVVRAIINAINNSFLGIDTVDKRSVYFKPSSIFFNYGENNMPSRLNIELGYVVDGKTLLDIKKDRNFNVYSLYHKDQAIRLSDPRDNSGNFGGKFLVNAPVRMSFSVGKDEDEIVLVNKKRIDVYNHLFEYDFRDLRSSARDDERIPFDEKNKDKNQKLDEENSHYKNEYVIELLKFKKGSNNTGEPIGRYKVVYVINTQSVVQNFKWYAWDPQNNPKQKELISEHLLNKDGEPIIDNKTGLPKLNPKFDKAIDPENGIKKQIIWIPSTTLQDKVMEQLKFVYPKDTTNSNGQAQVKITDFGLFAEASVLGKGALRNIFKDKNLKDSDVKYWRVNLFDASQKWVSNADIKLQPLNPNDGSGENSYMSEQGLWLVFATTSKGITNAKLILIDKDNKPNNYFFDEIKDKNDENNVSLQKSFVLFWESQVGKLLKDQLIYNEGLSNEQVEQLSYEQVWNHYQNWLLKTWQDYDPKIQLKGIEKDIFNDYIWPKTLNLRGLGKNQRKQIESEVNEWVQKVLSENKQLKGLKLGIDYIIEEFNDAKTKENWFNKLANVSIYGTEENKRYKGIALNFKGLVRIQSDGQKFDYSKSHKTVYFRNEAWHYYEPPVDLKTLNINDLSININKKDFEASYRNENQIDLLYRNAIKAKVINYVQNSLKTYNYEHDGQEIELGKDVKFENLDEVVSVLMAGKRNDGESLKLVGINANLLNFKEFNVKNTGEGGKYNLNNLTHLLIKDKDVVVQKTNYEDIRAAVVELVKRAASKVGLKADQDYQIYALNVKAYWFELIMKLNDKRILNKKGLHKILLREIDYLNDLKYIDVEGKKLLIPKSGPENIATKTLFFNQLAQIQNNVKREEANKGVNFDVFSKLVIVMPTKNTIGFGHGFIINKASKNYNFNNNENTKNNTKNTDKSIKNKIEDDFDGWGIDDEEGIINEKKISELIKEPHSISVDTSSKKFNNFVHLVKKNWWKILIVFWSIFGGVLGSVFLIRYLAKKYAWTYGKRVKKRQKNKKKSNK